MRTYIAYIFFTISGLTLMKMGGGQLSIGIKEGIFQFNLGVRLLMAFMMYGVSFILWSRIVAASDLTYIMPVSSAVVNILTLIVGIIIFKETMSIMQVIGMVVVTLGIVMMNIK